MSELFERLSDLFERGHRADIPDLLSDERFALADRTAEAAVLIAVTERPASNGGPGVILTQRPRSMRDHPGQVAFPGGKLEPGEDAVTAALREAEEELALAREHVRVIGTTDRYKTGTGFDVTPVLGVVPPDLELVPHPSEVADWFEAPLELLLDAHPGFEETGRRKNVLLAVQGLIGSLQWAQHDRRGRHHHRADHAQRQGDQ